MKTPLVPENETGIGEYAIEDDNDSVGSFEDRGTSPQIPRLTESIVSPKMKERFKWSQDASDEMIFHWLCTSRFTSQTLEDQRLSCVVKYNPLYWMVFVVTFLSLGLGREFHILLGQGGPVSESERRDEYEVRVHWVYCTTGAMLWVMARSFLTIFLAICSLYDPLDWIAIIVTWTLVICYCTGNSVFLKMMHIRSLYGIRSIIICNLIFSICMFGSLITFFIDVCSKFHQFNTWDAINNVYVLFEKTVAVVFFLMATAIYMRLWSIYRYDGRNFKRRILETIPSIIAAMVMFCLMYLALFYDKHEFQPYVWATFI